MKVRLEHFRAKWTPVRVKKMRPNKNLERFHDSVKFGNALAVFVLCQFSARHLTAMNRVRSIGQTQRPNLPVHVRQWKILRQACAAMHQPGRQRLPNPAARDRFDRDYRVFLEMHRQRRALDALI